MIGHAIKAARKAAGLTQEDLANAIGVKRSVVSKYENGQIGPRYQTVERIAAALHCDISDLVDSKKEAQLIVDSFIDEYKKTHSGQSVIALSKEENPEVIDAIKERKKSGSVVQEYTDFVANHPLVMQLIKDVGIELELFDWHTIIIRHNNQEEIHYISHFIDDLNELIESYKFKTLNMFRERYGLDIDSNEEE